MGTLIRLLAISLIALDLSAYAPALAQSAITDEAVAPNGTVTQKLAFTQGQKHAIYNAIARQKTKAPADRIAAAVGAPVPPSAALSALPDEVGGDPVWSANLKYAFVENQVVVVDPLAMRVVDVIRGGVRP